MSIKKTINYVLYQCLTTLAIVVLFVACNRARDSHQTENIRSTLASTIMPSPARLAETLVADPEYRKDCKAFNASEQKAQPDYLGILPGRSTAKDAKTLVGEPVQTSRFDQTDEWIYNGFNVYVENSLVTSINVYEDTRTLISLERLISEFGCPELIFAVDTSIDQPGGNYDLTKFIYYNSGIEIFFLEFPVALSDVPSRIVFFRPELLETYLERYNYVNDTLKNSKPVSWSEAVK